MMADERPAGRPRRDSWDSFKTVGDERQEYQRKDTLLLWICLDIFFSLITLFIGLLIFMFCLLCLNVVTGGRLLVVNPLGRVNLERGPIGGDRWMILLICYALGVRMLARYLTQPVLASYGASLDYLAQFAVMCLAYIPAVWFMRYQLRKRELAEQAQRQAREEAKRRRNESALNRGKEED
jgi:hypothetical protein